MRASAAVPACPALGAIRLTQASPRGCQRASSPANTCVGRSSPPAAAARLLFPGLPLHPHTFEFRRGLGLFCRLLHSRELARLSAALGPCSRAAEFSLHLRPLLHRA